jgi:hypothetical protein
MGTIAVECFPKTNALDLLQGCWGFLKLPSDVALRRVHFCQYFFYPEAPEVFFLNTSPF